MDSTSRLTQYPLPPRLVILALCAVLCAALAPAPLGYAASLSQNDAISLTARAGFDGYYKEGRWLPVRVAVENNGPDGRGRLEVASAAGFGGPAIVYSRELDLPSQSPRELFLYVTVEGYASSVEVRLVSAGQALAQPVTLSIRQLSGTDLLYGVLAGSPSAYNVLADVDPVGGQAYVAQLDVGDLPALSQAWHSLDVILFSDVDTGALAPEQRTALAEWVDTGGRLLVMGGAGWQKTAAGLNGLLPLAPAGARQVAELGALAEFASAVPVPAGEAVAAFGALTAGAAPLVGDAQAPLIAARRRGFGQVVYFAADLALAPLRAWDGAADLFRHVLAAPLDRPSWAPGMTNWSSAQSAIDALPDLQLPSPFLICGFLGLYLAVVGPLNYFALRFVKRRELAWITIPAAVLAFSLVAYLAGYGLAGSQPTLHQLAIVQAWPGSAQARLDQVVGIFSPRRATYDLEFAPGMLIRPVPGYSQPAVATLRFEQGDRPRLTGVRTEIAGVQTFVAQGSVPAPSFQADLTLELQAGTARLTGVVTNGSELTLDDAVLLAPGGVFQLGALGPGETRSVSLVLSGGRAAALSSGSVVPLAPGPSGPVVPAPYYPGAPDSTIDDILGTSNYYDDRAQFRRFSLLSAAINTYSTGTSLGRGGGVFLAGWTAQAPTPAAVLGTTFKTEAETLYLIALPSVLEAGNGPVTVPPGMMTWMSLGAAATSGAAAPYDATLYPGDRMAFRFQPVQPVAFASVRALTLNLAGSSYGSSASTVSPLIELWDFAQSGWVRLEAVTFGNRPVPEPERFVGAGGEIRAQLINPGPDTINLTSLEFTLALEP